MKASTCLADRLNLARNRSDRRDQFWASPTVFSPSDRRAQPEDQPANGAATWLAGIARATSLGLSSECVVRFGTFGFAG